MSKNENKPALIRMGDACKILGINPSTLWRWIKDGKVKRIPGTRFIPASEVERLREGRER